MNETVNALQPVKPLAEEHSAEEIVIEAGHLDLQYWRDLWRYRELLYFLAWRDILVRYKQTAIGILWAVLRPLLTMLVFTFIFGELAKLAKNAKPGDPPYAILVLAGTLPWQFFSNALSESGGSVLSNANLISKVYFPRLITPASSVVVSLVDFMISLVIMVALMLYYRFVPSARIGILPVFVLLTFAAAMGGGLWLSALTVKYRDFRYIVPFLVQFGFYVSPVGFSSQIVPEKWRLLYSLNPMVGAIDGFRWAILGESQPIYWEGMAISVGVSVLLLITGIWYFRSTERQFADVI